MLGVLLRAIYNHIILIIQLLLRGGSAQRKPYTSNCLGSLRQVPGKSDGPTCRRNAGFPASGTAGLPKVSCGSGYNRIPLHTKPYSVPAEPSISLDSPTQKGCFCGSPACYRDPEYRNVFMRHLSQLCRQVTKHYLGPPNPKLYILELRA